MCQLLLHHISTTVLEFLSNFPSFFSFIVVIVVVALLVSSEEQLAHAEDTLELHKEECLGVLWLKPDVVIVFAV